MLKKLSLLTLAVSLTLAPCMPLQAWAGDKGPADLLVPRAAFAPAVAEKGGSLRLIAKKFVPFAPDLLLVPTNPLVAQGLETPVLITLTTPEDNKRTHFFISTGALHFWDQISSTSSYRFIGTLRYRLTSSVLPAPGEMGFGIGLEAQNDFQPSALNTARQRDQGSSFGLDDEILAWLVKNQFPTLTDEQALDTARALIKSEIVWTMTVRVNVRSVSQFGIANASLQVWGD